MSNELEVERLTIKNPEFPVEKTIEITKGKIACKFPLISGELGLQASHPDRPNTRLVFFDRNDYELRGSATIELREIYNQPHLTIAGAYNLSGQRYSRTCINGDLLVKDMDNQTQTAQIMLGDQAHIFSSIGYTYADDVRFLLLEGAWYGPSNDRRRRTRIIGDLSVKSSGNTRGNIVSDGTIEGKEGVFDDVLLNSSQELKQDISTLTKEQAYSLLKDLEPVKFAFKDDPSKRDNIGFIAEDVPDIISSEDHKQIRYMEIISALTKVVKDLKNEVDELKEKNECFKIEYIPHLI